jgi:hydroxymethylpyrimidine pyrophosphatase-like HAD family hydrolase
MELIVFDLDETLLNRESAIIGHHDEEGIARFLRERFSLDVANG